MKCPASLLKDNFFIKERLLLNMASPHPTYRNRVATLCYYIVLLSRRRAISYCCCIIALIDGVGMLLNSTKPSLRHIWLCWARNLFYIRCKITQKTYSLNLAHRRAYSMKLSLAPLRLMPCVSRVKIQKGLIQARSRRVPWLSAGGRRCGSILSSNRY